MMFPPNEHAPLSPSRLQRIIDCPGSFNFGRKCEAETEETRSSYAEEGSMLHAAVECRILATQWNGPELTSGQQNAVEDAMDYFRALENTLASEPGYHLMVEERVYLKEYSSNLFECSGTCDILISTDTELHVLDWKFGQGIPVYAQDNDQLYAYAAGAAKNPEHMQKFEKILIHCIQPRLDSYDVHEISPKSLLQWINGRLIPGCSEALSDTPSFHPGPKQCRWCPAKTKCRARYNQANQTAADVFRVVEKLPDDVSQAELTELYKKSKVLTQYLKDIGSLIFDDLQAGTPWPGYKLVAGRSIRRWGKDAEDMPAQLIKFIEFDEMFTQKLVTPAGAEKLDRRLKKDLEFQKLITKPEGKPTLVDENDKRAPLQYRTAAQIFGELK